MTSLSDSDMDYIRSISTKLAPGRGDVDPSFNSSGDEGLEDLGILEEPEEVAQGPTLENFNGAVPDDGSDVSDSVLRKDKTALLSEQALSYDPAPEVPTAKVKGRTRERGMGVKAIIAGLSDSRGDPECLASIDGMTLKVESVGSDEDGRPMLILSEL